MTVQELVGRLLRFGSAYEVVIRDADTGWAIRNIKIELREERGRPVVVMGGSYPDMDFEANISGEDFL